MNVTAFKKFVDENQKFSMEWSNLLAACNKWEMECSLYDHDHEALMDFANEADERAKEAEVRIRDLEEDHDHEALMDFANEADERAKEAEVRIRDLEEDNKRLEEELHLCRSRCGRSECYSPLNMSVDIAISEDQAIENAPVKQLSSSEINIRPCHSGSNSIELQDTHVELYSGEVGAHEDSKLVTINEEKKIQSLSENVGNCSVASESNGMDGTHKTCSLILEIMF